MINNTVNFLKTNKAVAAILLIASLMVVIFSIYGIVFKGEQNVKKEVTAKQDLAVSNPYGKKQLHPETKKQLQDENYQNIITDVQLDEKIQSGEPVYVYVYSATCGYCSRATPKVMQTAKEMGITVYQFNLLEYEEGWNTYKIEGTPTLMFFIDKMEGFRLVGEYEKEDYKKWFEFVQYRK